MREIKFNVIGIITFIIFLLLEFVIDIVKGRGGSSETFSLLFIVGLVVSLVLFLKGTHKVLLHINPS
ncbi:MAG: hypothetical protein KKI13_05700, partial [Candidatus Omnitrophica bacterium]|nr:hypothetical protein [Candidatus Omnitrophota bacterium]